MTCQELEAMAASTISPLVDGAFPIWLSHSVCMGQQSESQYT